MAKISILCINVNDPNILSIAEETGMPKGQVATQVSLWRQQDIQNRQDAFPSVEEITKFKQELDSTEQDRFNQEFFFGVKEYTESDIEDLDFDAENKVVYKVPIQQEIFDFINNPEEVAEHLGEERVKYNPYKAEHRHEVRRLVKERFNSLKEYAKEHPFEYFFLDLNNFNKLGLSKRELAIFLSDDFFPGNIYVPEGWKQIIDHFSNYDSIKDSRIINFSSKEGTIGDSFVPHVGGVNVDVLTNQGVLRIGINPSKMDTNSWYTVESLEGKNIKFNKNVYASKINTNNKVAQDIAIKYLPSSLIDSLQKLSIHKSVESESSSFKKPLDLLTNTLSRMYLGDNIKPLESGLENRLIFKYSGGTPSVDATSYKTSFSAEVRSEYVNGIADAFSEVVDELYKRDEDQLNKIIDGDYSDEQKVEASKQLAELSRTQVIKEQSPAMLFSKIRRDLIDSVLNKSFEESYQEVVDKLKSDYGESVVNEMIEKNPEGASEYINDQILKKQVEFQKIKDFYPQLVQDAAKLLARSEGIIIKETGEIFDSYPNDIHEHSELREEMNTEGWQVNYEEQSLKKSLLEKVRLELFRIPKLDPTTGKVSKNIFGRPKNLNGDSAFVAIQEQLSTMTRREEMIPLLEQLAQRNPMFNQLVENVKNDGQLQTAFWNSFITGSKVYRMIFTSPSGIHKTKTLNETTGVGARVSVWSDLYKQGTRLNNYAIYDEQGKILLSNVQAVQKNAEELLQFIKETFRNNKEVKTPEDRQKLLSDPSLNINSWISTLLNAFGIDTTLEDINNVSNIVKGKSTFHNKILQRILKISNSIIRDSKNKEYKEAMEKSGLEGYDLYKRFQKMFHGISDLIPMSGESYLENKFQRGGKTKFTRQIPSYSTTLTQRLRGENMTEAEYQAYLDEEFGQYSAFKDENGWKVDTLKSLSEDPEFRKKFRLHKLNDINKIEYENWSPSVYSSALIHNFFSVPLNKAEDAKQYSLYALPVPSDATSNEYFTLERFVDKTEYKDTPEGVVVRNVSAKEQIVDRMIGLAKSEMERIAAVRQRRYKIQQNEEAIKQGKEPIYDIESIENLDKRGHKFVLLEALNHIDIDAKDVIYSNLFKLIENRTVPNSEIMDHIGDIFSSVSEHIDIDSVAEKMGIEAVGSTQDTINSILQYFETNILEIRQDLSDSDIITEQETNRIIKEAIKERLDGLLDPLNTSIQNILDSVSKDMVDYSKEDKLYNLVTASDYLGLGQVLDGDAILKAALDKVLEDGYKDWVNYSLQETTLFNVKNGKLIHLEQYAGDRQQYVANVRDGLQELANLSKRFNYRQESENNKEAEGKVFTISKMIKDIKTADKGLQVEQIIDKNQENIYRFLNGLRDVIIQSSQNVAEAITSQEQLLEVAEDVQDTLEADQLEQIQKDYEANKNLSKELETRTNQFNTIVEQIVMQSTLESNMRNFFFNSYKAKADIYKMLITDPALYKGSKDMQKRIKETYSPKRPLDTHATWVNPETGVEERVGKEYENSITLYDEIGVSNFLDVIKETFSGLKQTSESEYKNIIKGYEEVEVSDGQAFRGLTSHRRVSIMGSQWSDALESSYRRIKSGKFNRADIQAMYGAIKPFTFGYRPIDSGTEYGNFKVSIQHKNSEFTILTNNNTSDGKSLFTHAQAYSETLKGLERVLEDPSLDIDTIQFKSTTKHGNIGLIGINENMTADEVVQAVKDKILKKDSKGEPIVENGKYVFDQNYYTSIKYEDYGFQVATPEHYIDTKAGVGVQMRRILASNIPKGTTFDIKGNKLNKDQFVKSYNKLWEKLLRQKYQQLEDMFTWENPQEKKEKLKEIGDMIKSEMNRSNRFNPELVEACSLNENGEFNIPLHESMQSERIQSLLLSMFKNRVTRYEMPGGSLIQATPWGINDKAPQGLEGKRRPEVIFDTDENGNKYIKHVECIMPWYTKDFFQNLLGDSLTLDLNNLTEEQRKKIDPLLNVIGYRIPTEARYSIFNMKIIDFGTPQAGGHIIMPREMTRVAGFDFDVDKIYFLRPEHDYSKKYDTSEYLQDILEEYAEIEDIDESSLEDSKALLQDVLDAPRKYLNSENDFLADVAQEWLEIREDYREYDKETIDIVDYDIKLEQDGSIDVESLDTRQLHNLFLDMAKSSLSNPNMIQEQLNPGGFDSWKLQSRIMTMLRRVPLDTMQKVFKDVDWKGDFLTQIKDKYTIGQLEDILDKYGKQDDILSPISQVETFKSNVTGIILIGMAANHLTNHSLAQESKLELKPEQSFVFADKTLTKLNQTEIDGRLIARVISEVVAASADNGKDPLLGDLNQSSLTLDTSLYLARLGYELHEIMALMNQPVIVDMIQFMADNEFTNYRGAFTTYMKNKFGRDLSTLRNKDLTSEAFRKASSMENLSNLMLIYKKMQENKATPNEIKKYSTDSQTLILLFDRIYGQAEYLNKIIGATKYDSQSGAAGGSIYKTQINNWKSTELLELSEKERSPIPFLNVETILPKPNLSSEEIKESPIAPLQASYTYGVEGALKSLQKLFPQLTSPVQQTLQQFKQIVPTKLNESDLRKYYEALQTYLLTGVPLFGNEISKVADMGDTEFLFSSQEKREQYLKKFPKYFTNQKYQFKDTAINNFLRSIVKQSPDSRNPIEYLTFKHIGKMSESQLQDYQIQWESMLNHEDASIRKMAISLAVYDFMRTGFSFSSDSYSSMCPNTIKMNMPGYIQELRDWVDKGINLSDLSEFNKQYLLHNLDNTRITPEVSIREYETVQGREKIIEKLKSQNIDPTKTLEAGYIKQASLVPIDISPDSKKIRMDFRDFISKDQSDFDDLRGSSSEVLQAMVRRMYSKNDLKYSTNVPQTLKMNIEGETVYYMLDTDSSGDGVFNYIEVTPLGSYLSGHEYHKNVNVSDINPIMNKSREQLREEQEKLAERSDILSVEALENMGEGDNVFVDSSSNLLTSEVNESVEISSSELTGNDIANSIIRLINFNEGGVDPDSLDSKDSRVRKEAEGRFGIVVTSNMNKILNVLQSTNPSLYQKINDFRNDMIEKASRNDPDAEDFLNTSTIEFTNNLKGRKMLNTLEAIEILIDTHLQEDLFFDKYPGREYLIDENSKESIDNALKHQKVTFLDVQGYSKTSDERLSELRSLDDVSQSNIHLLVSESLERFSRQDPDFKKFFDKYIVTNEQKMYLYESLEKAAQYDNKGNRSLDLLTFKNAVVEQILKENGKDILDNDDTLLSKYIC